MFPAHILQPPGGEGKKIKTTMDLRHAHWQMRVKHTFQHVEMQNTHNVKHAYVWLCATACSGLVRRILLDHLHIEELFVKLGAPLKKYAP